MSEEIKATEMWTREQLLEMREDSGKAIEKLGGLLGQAQAEIAALKEQLAAEKSARGAAENLASRIRAAIQ